MHPGLATGVVCAIATGLAPLPGQQPFGVPTPDPANGLRASIELPSGPLHQGQAFPVTFRGTRTTPQPAWLLVATAPRPPLHIGGVTLHVATDSSAVWVMLPLTLPANPTGPATLNLPVQLPAYRYFLQLLVDTGGGFAASPGYELPVFATAPTQGSNPHNLQSPVGVNLAGIADWASQRPFLDAFRSSREWISGDANTWDNGWPLQLDGNGNVIALLPGQIARTVLLTDVLAGNAGGRYVCLYEGVGTIQYTGAATQVVGLSAPGRHVVDVDTSGSVVLNVVATSATNPLRNVHFVPEASEATYATEIFTPEFLARTRKFSTLRFMDWGCTNGSSLATWSQRPRPDEVRWSTTRGVPVEIMVELANRLDADAWFCIPHLADDNYVTQFATWVRDHLEPGRKAYVEHSNEVWNLGFAQALYAQQRGVALNLSGNAYEAQLRYHSLRSVQIFQLFTTVFGGTNRLVRVLASQAVNPWTGTTVADFQNAWQSADALATAPYFGPMVGPSSVTQYLAMSVPQLLDHVATVEIPGLLASTQQNSTNAAARGLAHIAYEGGQHLVGVGGAENNVALTNLLISANRDPRMAELYEQYLGAWRTAGGRLFVHYHDIGQASKWGSWGALEFRDQDVATAPKHLALQSFLLTNPRWW